MRSGARVRKVSLGSAPRADTRKSVCGAGFGERLTANNCSKKAIFLQLGIKTARRARKRGVLGIHKTNYVVKTTELERKPRGGRGKGVFSGFTKRITLLKQRNWRENRAPGAVTGCFRESQNELRCKNNGIRGETARRTRECGCFGDSQNESRCKNNGIRGETARWTRERGVFGNRKTNYVVKTTELGRKPRGRCGQQMESCAGGGTLSKKCAKNANWTGAAALSPRRRGYAAGAETGCFRDSQNELRCKNNGIGEETARRARRFNF